MKLLSIGFGNFVSGDRIIAVVSPDSAPIKRIVQQAKARDMLIDATYGRKTKSVIITDCDYIVICAKTPETLSNKPSIEEVH